MNKLVLIILLITPACMPKPCSIVRGHRWCEDAKVIVPDGGRGQIDRVYAVKAEVHIEGTCWACSELFNLDKLKPARRAVRFWRYPLAVGLRVFLDGRGELREGW